MSRPRNCPMSCEEILDLIDEACVENPNTEIHVDLDGTIYRIVAAQSNAIGGKSVLDLFIATATSWEPGTATASSSAR